MLFRFTDIPTNYYNFWLRIVNFENKVKIIPVDFDQSWLLILLKQKRYFIYILLAETLDNVFYTLIPLLLGWLVATQKVSYFFIFILGWIIAISIEYIALYYSALLQMQTIHSILYYAHRFFLTVDPIYHTTRSRGKIVGKIDRGINAYEDFLDIIAFDVLPTIVGITTVLVSFWQFNTLLAILASIMIFIIGIINIILQFITTKAFEPRVISASDKLNNISLENLSQVQYIRSCFASNQIDESLFNTNAAMMNIGGTSLIAFSALTFFTRLAYIISIFILGTYLIMLVNNGTVSLIVGTALLLTYINGSYEVMRVGKKIKRYLKCTTRIKDLFSFIQKFGKQTFPVLSMQDTTEETVITTIQKKNALSVELHIDNLGFAYSSNARIFEGHNFYLKENQQDTLKLYGIIGPSGIGKTTLISILGGQLHPDTGSIIIQDVDIYKVDDKVRHYLVALQGQVASSLRGSIKYNLLFGLPNGISTYTDQDLIQVLESVGLWPLFVIKDGLNTLVGESGLNLSGGQRQRLNFANLYLRAHYYKPAVILIDEPTSSLDQVSEQAITHMIDELAKTAITFVIAHRLHTLEHAVGILDFSLIKSNKTITFYNKQDLHEVSAYYRKLISGQIEFE